MKALRNWAIATLIFTLIFLALSIVCIFRPQGFGEFVVSAAEEVTCNLGYTVEGMYNKLSIISYVFTGFFFVLNQVLWIAYACKKKACCENEKTNMEEVVDKKEQKRLAKEAKKAERAAKKLARKEKFEKAVDKVSSDAIEIAREVKKNDETKKPETTNEKLAAMINLMRNK